MPTENDILLASEYGTREDLELYIAEMYGNTPDPKTAIINGTIAELRALKLSHGDTIWGVSASATDYQEQVVNTPPERGEVFKSKLNGISI